MATAKKSPVAKKATASKAVAAAAEIVEIGASDSIKSVVEETKGAVYVKTGLTGGKRFVVTVRSKGRRPTLIALHL